MMLTPRYRETLGKWRSRHNLVLCLFSLLCCSSAAYFCGASLFDWDVLLCEPVEGTWLRTVSSLSARYRSSVRGLRKFAKMFAEIVSGARSAPTRNKHASRRLGPAQVALRRVQSLRMARHVLHHHPRLAAAGVLAPAASPRGICILRRNRGGAAAARRRGDAAAAKTRRLGIAAPPPRRRGDFEIEVPPPRRRGDFETPDDL